MTHDSTGKLRVPSDAALDAAIDRFAQSVIDLGDYAAKAQIATSLEALMRYRTEREDRDKRASGEAERAAALLGASAVATEQSTTATVFIHLKKEGAAACGNSSPLSWVTPDRREVTCPLCSDLASK